MKLTLTPEEVADILIKHFTEKGYKVGEVFATTNWFGLNNFEVEILGRTDK